MTIQYSVSVRNARQDAVEVAVGASPKLRLYNGTKPATCAAALSGNTLLCEMSLPSDWLAAASGGSKALSGLWSGTGAAAGTVTFFRIYDNAGTTCHEQGSVSATGGGGDMTMDNTVVAIGQAVAVNTHTTTDGNA